MVDEEKEEVRKAALEFMISLSEAKGAMVKRVDGWTAAIVRGCLEGMGALGEDSLDVWLEADVCHSILVASFISCADRAMLACRRPDRRFIPAHLRTIAGQTRMRSRW